MTAWAVIIAITIGTIAFRAGVFVLVADRGLPNRMHRALEFIAPAALGALVASMLLTDGVSMRAAPTAELLAVLAAFVVTRRSGNLMHAIAVGLPMFWIVGLIVARS